MGDDLRGTVSDDEKMLEHIRIVGIRRDVEVVTRPFRTGEQRG
jgi:hypothetical protein